MPWLTDDLLLAALAGLFVVEQIRILPPSESLLHQTWNGTWRECPVLLENSRRRLVLLPFQPATRVVPGSRPGQLRTDTDSSHWLGDELPLPEEVRDVIAFVDEWKRTSSVLTWYSTGFALSLVGCLLLWRGVVDLGMPHQLRWGVALTLLLWGSTVASFHRASAQLHPSGKASSWKPLLELLVSPLSALRATTLLGQCGCSQYSRGAVTWALLELPSLHRWARSLSWESDHVPATVPSWPFHENADLRQQLDELLKLRGSRLEEALAPPLRDRGAMSYCPRCHGQFIDEPVTCPDCQDVPCQGFDASPEMPWPRTSGQGAGVPISPFKIDPPYPNAVS